MEHLLLQPLFLVSPRDISERWVQLELYRVKFLFLEPMPCYTLYKRVRHIAMYSTKLPT